jgi:hypothetical protein
MPTYLPEEQSFEMAPAGSHVAICYRVIDLGTQYSDMFKTAQRKITLGWELPTELMTTGQNTGKPFSVHKTYTLSSNEKSNLRIALESWRGAPFSKEDFGKFDIAKLIGKPCLLGIVHEDKNGKTRAVIKSIMRVPKGMSVPAMVNQPIDFSLTDFNQTVYDGLSENLKAMIAKSPEYQHLKGGGNDPNSDDDDHSPVPEYSQDVPF